MKILILVAYLVISLKAEFIDTTVSNFVIEVLTDNNKNFIIDENIDIKLKVNQNKKISLDVLDLLLKKHNYQLKNIDDYYYLSKYEKNTTRPPPSEITLFNKIVFKDGRFIE